MIHCTNNVDLHGQLSHHFFSTCCMNTLRCLPWCSKMQAVQEKDLQLIIFCWPRPNDPHSKLTPLANSVLAHWNRLALLCALIERATPAEAHRTHPVAPRPPSSKATTVCRDGRTHNVHAPARPGGCHGSLDAAACVALAGERIHLLRLQRLWPLLMQHMLQHLVWRCMQLDWLLLHLLLRR